MNYGLRFSEETETCIDEQLAWYEADESHGGVELADRWFAKLQESLIPLTEKPTRHGFAPENGLWLPHLELRQMRFRPWKGKSVWRVLYVIDEESKSVTVLQIRLAGRPFLFEEKD